MKRLTALFLVLCLAPPLWAGDRVRGRRSYDEALVLYLHGDFKEALASVTLALENDPRLAQAYGLRARLWHVLGDNVRMKEDAANVLSKLTLSLSTLGTEELITQGSALLLSGQPDKAITSFNTALRAQKLPEGLAGRARVWRAKGELAKAMSDLDDAIKLAPTSLYYYNRAQNHYDLGEYDKSIADLAASLRLSKSSYISFGLLGSALAKKGDMKRSLQAYNKALTLNPEYAYGYLGRAAVYLVKGEEEAAFKDFEEAARVNSHDYAPYFNRAEAYWRRGNREEALADYRRVLSADLRDSAYAVTVGDRFTYYLLWKEAIDAYTRAFALKKGAQPLIRRAAAWEALKDPRKAMADLDAAVEAEPAAAPAFAARGLLALRLGNEDKAIADLNRAVKLDPKDSQVRVGRGSVYARTDKPKAALEDFNAAIEADPKLAEAYNNRGALYANAFGDMDKALRDIVTACELKPQSAGYQFNLGMMRLKARLYLKAIDSFNAALSLKGPMSRILQARADAHFQLGDHGAALRDIQTALEKDPKNGQLYDTLGTMRLGAHDYEQAIRDLNQAVQLDPGGAPAYIHRGEAYGAMGSLKQALADFRKASELEPRSREAWTFLCQTRRLLKDPQTAIKDCSRAIDVDVSYAPAYLQRGLAFLMTRDAGRTIEDINSAAQLGLRKPEGLLAQAIAHAAARQYKEAHRIYQQAMAIDPNVRAPHLDFGGARAETDDFFNAMAELDPLMSADVNDPYVYLVRADALQNAEHFDKAILEYTRAMEMDGSIADAYVGRGTCLAAQDSFDAAQQDFIHALELNPQDAGTHVRLATLLTIRRDFKGALSSLAAALKLDPANSEAYLRAGNVQYFQGAYGRALENYSLAAKHDPGAAAAFNGVGLGYFALKKYPEALESFSRAIALNPRSDRFYKNRASTYTNMRKFGNAAVEFKSASLVNTDPALVDEYKKLINESEAQSGGDKS